MITNVSLKHTTENLKEGHKAVLMKQDTIYTANNALSLASFVMENNHLLFLYTEYPSTGVEVTEAISLYKEYPKGVVLTITQTETVDYDF